MSIRSLERLGSLVSPVRRDEKELSLMEGQVRKERSREVRLVNFLRMSASSRSLPIFFYSPMSNLSSLNDEILEIWFIKAERTESGRVPMFFVEKSNVKLLSSLNFSKVSKMILV